MYTWDPFPLLGDLLQIGFFGFLVIGFLVMGVKEMYQKGKKVGLKREKKTRPTRRSRTQSIGG